MPRDINGVYTLPSAAFSPNTVIESALYNNDLSDIATALTQSIATTGVSAMTGPVKLENGTIAAPAIVFVTELTTGFYRKSAGVVGLAANSVDIFTVDSTELGFFIGNIVLDSGNLVLLAGNLSITGNVQSLHGNILVGGDLEAQTGNFVDNQGKNIYATPIGAIADLGKNSAPGRWLLCNGQAVSRATYANLFSAIGTTFGAGDTSTTFNLPDYRGRVAAGDDDMGAGAANRLTNAATGGCSGTIGNSGGEQGHQLTIAELASHFHSYQGGNYASSRSATPDASTDVSPNAGFGTGNNGSDQAHNNVQPTLVIYKMIYAGVSV